MDCNVKIQLLNHLARLPEKAHDTDACFDVEAVCVMATDMYLEYSLGFATVIPEGWQGLIYPRSSISKYGLALCNGVAVIDSDYRGEWKVRFRRIGGMPALPIYMPGEKIAQIQFQRVPTVSFEVVDSLPDTQRGVGGFGSSGA